MESLLDFGRMEAGARPYRLEPLDAAELAEDGGGGVPAGGAGKDFTIECDVPAGAMVHADREALAQALWNLLDNAVKYSGDSRIVRVEVEHGGEVAIRVRDQGLGIPASEQKQDLPEVRPRRAPRQAGSVKGTGIGLAMVKHIVDAHGGQGHGRERARPRKHVHDRPAREEVDHADAS